MLSNNTCFVCETSIDFKVEQEGACPCCSSKLRAQDWLDSLTIIEQSIYLTRLIEAKDRWLKLGRYDQSPKNSNLPTITAASNNSVAIGGELV